MRILSAIAGVSAAGLTLAGIAAIPASAALNTSCVGTAGEVTVPGNLFVPAGKSCDLSGTTVEGKVTVRAGANLTISDGTLKGGVAVAEDGYFDAYRTTVTGNVAATGAYGVYLDEASVSGSYTGSATENVTPFAYVGDSSVGRDVAVVGGETLVDGSTVGRHVSGEYGEYVDLMDSTVAGELTVRSMSGGTVVCGSEVDGRGGFIANNGVQIGTGDHLTACDAPNYFGSFVYTYANHDGVWVSGNIIRGDLRGTGNKPAPVGSDNRVRGDLLGQYVDLKAPDQADAPTDTTARRSAPSDEAPAATDKAEELKQKGAERKSAAEAAAAKAGPANL